MRFITLFLLPLLITSMLLCAAVPINGHTFSNMPIDAAIYNATGSVANISQQLTALVDVFSGRSNQGLSTILADSLLGSVATGGTFHGLGIVDLMFLGSTLLFAASLIPRRDDSFATEDTDMSHALHQSVDTSSSKKQTWKQAQAEFSTSKEFHAEKFLKQARDIYLRLQQAWDKHDLARIETLTTPEMFIEIRQQMEGAPAEYSHTELLGLEARLFKVEESTDTITGTVCFDALLRENAVGTPIQTQELWHFVRPRSSDLWRLDDFQQIESQPSKTLS